MTNGKLPAWFWVIVGLAVVWNIMGVGAYIADVTMSPEALAELPQAQQDLRAETPGWLTGAYAIAVFAGLAAAIMLCLKKALAIPLFAVSLVAVVVQMGYVFFGMNAAEVLGPGSMTFPAIIIVLSALQLGFSMYTKSKDLIA